MYCKQTKTEKKTQKQKQKQNTDTQHTIKENKTKFSPGRQAYTYTREHGCGDGGNTKAHLPECQSDGMREQRLETATLKGTQNWFCQTTLF